MKANVHTIVWRDWTSKDVVNYVLEDFLLNVKHVSGYEKKSILEQNNLLFKNLDFLIGKNNTKDIFSFFQEIEQTDINLTKLKLIEEIIEKWFLKSNFKKVELTEVFISEIKGFSDTERDPNRKDVLIKRNYMKEKLEKEDLHLPAPLINSENKLLDGYNRMLLAKNINLKTIKAKKLTIKTENKYLFGSPLLTAMIQNIRLKNTSFSATTCFQTNYDVFDYFN